MRSRQQFRSLHVTSLLVATLLASPSVVPASTAPVPRTVGVQQVKVPEMAFIDDKPLGCQENMVSRYRLTPVELLPILSVPKIDPVSLLREDLSKSGTGPAPLKIGVATSVSYSVVTKDFRELGASGYAIGRYKVDAPGALTIDVGFSRYALPDKGRLWLYSPNCQHILGPFSSELNNVSGRFWSPLLAGGEAIVEVVLPSVNPTQVVFEIDSVTSGFRDVLGLNPLSWNHQTSDARNIDTACSQADNWRDEVRSVGFILYQSISDHEQYMCSGALVNNTDGDISKLYFLTANHCDVDPPTANVYWNYENSYCRSPGSTLSGQEGDGPTNHVQIGSTHIASWANTDFRLLRLNGVANPNYNLFWAGWDASTSLPSRVVGIHHPNGAEKRISFDDDRVSPYDDNHVYVEWDRGGTEGGSSGSPLFNQDKRVVGQLHGPACSWSDFVCDRYGWFVRSWRGGGSEQSRLSSALAKNNDWATSINGRDSRTGGIGGRVQYANGVPAVGATVVFHGGAIKSSTTDAAGYYSFGSVPYGPTEITAYVETTSQTAFRRISSSVPLNQSKQASAIIFSGAPMPAPCPSSGFDVALYFHANYDCGLMGEGAGYLLRNGTGWQNVLAPINDQASSVRVRPGWSVKLFEHADRGGGSACRNGDDPTFAGDYFGNRQSLNDKVSSFEVFSNPYCELNVSPRTPSYPSPGDGTVVRSNSAPTLCWTNNGDPNGDSVQFYAEVFQSAVNTNSGWTSGTCWRPAALDGHFNAYQWRVRARDSQGAESGWSSTWHFTLQNPNWPPTISFNSANGSAASRIDTNQQDWTFAGTAGDPEGQFNRVEWRCSGYYCGNGSGSTASSNWSFSRNGMDGRNDVWFAAFDNQGALAESRHLDLRIDRAPPSSILNLNGQPGGWPEWFTGDVQIGIQATDNCTGGACSGVSRIVYQLDGGVTQTVYAGFAGATVTSGGAHTVQWNSVDVAGNASDWRLQGFKIDRTPPTDISGVVETHGTASNIWQKANNIPSYSWAQSSDALSGLWGYQLYFGEDASGAAGQFTALADQPRQWTPMPAGVRTGTYFLRGRARDVAGNWSPWLTLHVFRFDGTPPENPTAVTHADGIANNTWQTRTSTPNFSWSAATDIGSGVKGYLAYWGPDPDGTSASLITSTSFSAGPLCGAEGTCVGYLRLRSVDNVDTPANDWSSVFTLRYDNQPPVADFAINGGVTETNQIVVQLDMNASDAGSGVKWMRVSGDGRHWTDWETYGPNRSWEIPGISLQYWPVYLQVRDGVGINSAIMSRTVFLDVNPRQPRSDNYRLFDGAMVAGGGEHESGAYKGRSSVGQVMDSITSVSAGHIITGGFEAASRAIPITEPVVITYTFIAGTFSTGNSGTPVTSSSYSMIGTLGEPGVPNNVISLTSSSFSLMPGFLAMMAISVTSNLSATPTLTDSTPTPAAGCAFPTISLNDAALYTNATAVTLTLCAPRAAEMMLSNDGGFAGAVWEPFTTTRAWTIAGYGQYVLPRYVYAAFRDAEGNAQAIFFDDIILDPNPPVAALSLESGPAAVAQNRMVRKLSADGTHAVYAASSGALDLVVAALDDNSGPAAMQIGDTGDFSNTLWEPYSALMTYSPMGGDGIKNVFVRLRDAAGNVSEVTSATIMIDTMSPVGGLTIQRRVVGPDVVTTTVYLGSNDELAGVQEMRLSALPDFADSVWQPVTDTVVWVLSPTNQVSVTLYVQFRDGLGNLSEISSDSYLNDTTAPEVYAETSATDPMTREVRISAFDDLSGLGTLRLSNDPLMLDDVATLSFTDTLMWAFDERRVVWVQVSDGVGNWAAPYPAYAPPKPFEVFLPIVQSPAVEVQ